MKKIQTTTIQWKQKIQTKQVILMLITFLIAGSVSFAGYQFLDSRQQEKALIPVFIAIKDMERYEEIQKNDITQIMIPKKYVPKEHIQNIDEIIGKNLTHPVIENEIIMNHSIQEKGRNNSYAFKLEDGHIAVALKKDWFESPFPKMVEGDYGDIYASVPNQSLEETKKIVKSVKILKIRTNNFDEQEILCELSSEEVKTLLFTHTNKAKMVFVLTKDI